MTEGKDNLLVAIKAGAIRPMSSYHLSKGELGFGWIHHAELEALLQAIPLSDEVRTALRPSSGLRNTMLSFRELAYCVTDLMDPKEPFKEHDRLGLLLLPDGFLILCLRDRDGSTRDLTAAIIDRIPLVQMSRVRLVLTFFEEVLRQDETVREELENQLERLEKEVHEQAKKVNQHRFLLLSRRLRQTQRCYRHLLDIFQQLMMEQNDEITKSEETLRQLLEERLRRDTEEIGELAGNLGEIEAYHQGLQDLELNRSMQKLTLVTTVCLPLSLIAAWYGMNFTAMPELSWQWGYLYVMLLSAAVVGLVCFFLFHRR